MRGKAVCRFHGGKSTGPKTVQGKQRIREAHLRHGLYAKDAKLHLAANRELKRQEKILDRREALVEKKLEQLQLLQPYIQAFRRVNRRVEFSLLQMFLFGDLNGIVRKNPILKEKLQELFSFLFEADGFAQFEALTAQFDQSLCKKLGLSPRIWEKLTPGARQEEYLQQLLMRFMDVWPEVHSAAAASPVKC